MTKYLRTLSRTGVTDEMSERDAGHVVVLNVVVLLVFFIAIQFMSLTAAYLPATWLILVCMALHTLSIGFTLLWNHHRNYLAARIWFSACAAFFLTLYTVLLGTETLYNFFLVVCIFQMFYLFPAREKFWMYAMSGVFSACFVATEILFRERGLLSDIPAQYVLLLFYFNMIGILFCALSMGGFGHLTLRNAEEKFAREHEHVQDKSRQLEIANKYKSHYIASASHDLRQPLHALNMFVGQLQRETDRTKRSQLVERIDATVSSMNELFGGLLDMTKLEAGILEPHVTEFSVARLLRRIETTFSDAAHEKGLRLRVIATRAWVRSDVILLERMLLNLVSNAVRYTARGGIVVGCRRRGAHLRFDVCDTGPGIPEDQQVKIFEEHYQVLEAEPDRGGGLGLGLAIVDRLGNLLAHPIELASRPNRGTRFSVLVPLIVQQGGLAEKHASPPTIADPMLGKFIVVIDDDVLVLEGMSGILRSWGCVVVAGDSAAAALSQLAGRRRTPDLIISDYRLASGDIGLAAITRLREAFRADIPAFLISGDTAPERLRDAAENGFLLLHKPVPPMRLRTMLNQVLRSRPTTVAAPTAE
jgi:signal transduction histidine kinase